MICPNCGIKTIQNKKGDEVCPNCGIIKFDGEESNEKPEYIG